MTKQKLINILLNVTIILVGILILAKPEFGLAFFRYYLGAILLISAAILFFFYYKSEPKIFNDLIKILVLAILGCFFLISFNLSFITLGLALGIWMIIETIINLRLAFIYKKAEIKAWLVFLIFGAVSLIAAFYLLQNLELSAILLLRIAALFVVIRSILALLDTIVYQNKLLD